MEQPKGCMVPRNNQKVYRLVKSLYGLKQAPKQCHSKFDHVLISNGFPINDANKRIYRKVENNSCIINCLYIDDMLIFRNYDAPNPRGLVDNPSTRGIHCEHRVTRCHITSSHFLGL